MHSSLTHPPIWLNGWLTDHVCFRDLYILALSEMQAMDESEELSYFSLAGKRGYVPWSRQLFGDGLGVAMKLTLC